MKQYKFLRHTALAGVVSAALVTGVVACGDNDGGAPVQARTALNGEVVFRGLAFHEGAVVALLPELGNHPSSRELTPEDREVQERVKSQMVADIREADPAFFDRFGADIQSGDHLRIERAMKESGALVKQVSRKRAPAVPAPGATHGMCSSNTVSGNVAMDNTSAGNISYSNTVSDNTVYANSVSANSAYNNSVYGNVDEANSVYANTSFANESYAGDNAYSGDEIYAGDDGDNENGWAGSPLGRDQLVDLIATRLATE